MHNGKVNFIDICCVETLEELDSINKKFIIIVDTRFGAVDNLGDNIIIAP
jgi:pantothenate synthetase